MMQHVHEQFDRFAAFDQVRCFGRRMLEVEQGRERDLPATLQLVCARSSLSVPRVRAVADLLVQEFNAGKARG